MDLIHTIVTNDYFLLITGLCSIGGALTAILVATKVIKIYKKLSINNQNIAVDGNNNITSGGNNVITKQ